MVSHFQIGKDLDSMRVPTWLTNSSGSLRMCFTKTIMPLERTSSRTNWGNLAYPGIYTSYDYAASISEDRTLRPKFSEIKLQGLFLHATPHYHLAGRISTGTSLSSSQQIFTTHLATPQGQNLYIVRQTTNNSTARVEFDLKVNTTGGQVILPGLALNGRESKIIVSEYPFGKSLLRYSTGEVRDLM
ncbi:beta-galactosidase domain-containing protein [Rhizoctonia solani AG-1 IA]|uniref:Beta-galactosidase domain-containing protein n=1 Tax=Thanatephorus cucumeris (strain AG1-IA) TaxID=983506 RepID=L8WCQ8_THACA|nr:beta-galactosidase domain-containing protein [Rhizoctonia solani AG-1 IA]